ncbi:RNA polymerase sigma factor [Actinacidiphila acididurans]|uniref:RNA polymerase sigma factor n=1 Tax=Actinacidiphila acididurans TaxID=2784346 RepID=UPI0027DAF7B4|nr:RNA polymerase sigma factor [Actinacidiphila acididurans]
MSDIELVRRIGRDPAALEEVYRAHVEQVTRFVARRVSDPHKVVDLTAEVFLQAVSSAESYRGAQHGVGAWLYGIARNVTSAHWRQEERERGARASISGRRMLEDDDLLRLEERIDAERQARQLYSTLAGLPDGERAVLELIAVDGLSVTQAAAALGISSAAARVRLHRARRTMRASQREPTPQGVRPVEYPEIATTKELA